MNKIIRKNLILFFFLLFTIKSANASLLWDINIGIEQYRKNDFKFCKNYFIDYIKSNPNDDEGYYWLARTYANLKDEKNANENFKKAHEIAFMKKNIEKIDFNIDINSNIEDYFDMASMYFETGDLKQALNYADLILEINPKSSSAYFIKSKIAQINGDEQKAIEFLNQAILYNNKLIKTNLAKSLNIRQLPEMTLEMYEIFALEAYYSNDISSAIKYCRKYLAINNSNADIANILIDLYIKNNDISLAQSLIDDVLNNIGSNIQTILYQAKICALKNDERLEGILLSAYKINPNHKQVLLELGNYYLKKENYLKSKEYFEMLISIDDLLYEAYFGYIYSLLELGEIENAMNLIKKISSINPDTSENYYLLAKICEKSGNFDDAINYLDNAIQSSKNPYYYLYRGKINYILKNYKNSINDLKFAQKMAYDYSLANEAQDYLISNYLKTNDLINAQIHLNKKLSLDKNRILYKYDLYVLYKLQGNTKMATTQFEAIVKAKPITLKDYVDLSEIYYDLGEYEKAIKTLDKAIKKFPKETALYIQKAKIYTLLNKKKEAKNAFYAINKIQNN